MYYAKVNIFLSICFRLNATDDKIVLVNRNVKGSSQIGKICTRLDLTYCSNDSIVCSILYIMCEDYAYKYPGCLIQNKDVELNSRKNAQTMQGRMWSEELQPMKLYPDCSHLCLN